MYEKLYFVCWNCCSKENSTVAYGFILMKGSLSLYSDYLKRLINGINFIETHLLHL